MEPARVSSLTDVVRIEDRYYILATSSLADERTRVLKRGETFGVFDRHGDIRPLGASAQGIYHRGTRFLNHLELRLDDRRPLLLSSTVKENNLLLAVDLSNPELFLGDQRVPQDSLHVFRGRVLLDGAALDRLRVVNYSEERVRAKLSLRFDADFADIFEARGMRRPHRGRRLETVPRGDRVVLGYEGLDDVTRRLRITFDPAPVHLDAEEAFFEADLEPHGEAVFYVTFSCEVGDDAPATPRFEDAHRALEEELETEWQDHADIDSTNEAFAEWMGRSFADVHMLKTRTRHGDYPYAGVPWFSAPFGRDGILTAYNTLWAYPQLARGVLTYLAATQATEYRDEDDCEPGKILHETREGEMAALNEVPFGRYYGSVDSTPLFVMLAGAYHERTGDDETLRALWPNVERALAWMEKHGDRDGDGFLEYEKHSPDGLVHQGWKDSTDCVFHSDGTPAKAPIALVEVQAYAYAARLAAAELGDALGHADRARELRRDAATLKARFDEAFWSDEIGMYALALDCDKRPCEVRSSNAGHALFAGLVPEHRARELAESLLAPDMFSGWGIRTISSKARRFNPMSYHNGSIWPHDNALIAKGFANYGFKGAVQRVMEGLFRASLQMDLKRLPELFCGFDRRGGEAPTLYPVACSPQAWAATTPLLLVESVLGLKVDGRGRRVVFDSPALPDFAPRIFLRNLAVGASRVDVALRRYDEDVTVNLRRREGPDEVFVDVVKRR